jgi:hypothetical protein
MKKMEREADASQMATSFFVLTDLRSKNWVVMEFDIFSAKVNDAYSVGTFEDYGVANHTSRE